MNRIFEQLNEIIKNSSSKYYHYPVAAILECNDGRLFPGVNIETSSPASGICAERCAIFSAMAQGLRKEDFKRIYILNQTESNISPCFICRQALNDYCNQDLEIISYNNKGIAKTWLLKELCVEAFEEDNLKWEVVL